MTNFSDLATRTDSAKRAAKKFVVIFSGVVVVLLIVTSLVLTYGTYSTGVRAGTIVKISKRGYLMKTYEGQLSVALVGGTNEGTVPMAQMWDFSVSASHPELIEALEAAALKGGRVRLGYEERYVSLPWNGDTKYFVNRVESE